MTERRSVSPIAAGLRSRCPRCGDGRLFDGYLKVAARCESCGLELSKTDPGDGPAVFVIFIVGALVVPVAFILEFSGVAFWLNMLISLPLAIGLTLALLPLFKSALIALQFHHKAEEARFDDGPDGSA